MSREVVGKGLRFSLRHAPCAHICRYCLISESRKRSALPFSRFEQLVHRFHDWRQSQRPDLEIGVFVGPSFDYDLETLKGVARGLRCNTRPLEWPSWGLRLSGHRVAARRRARDDTSGEAVSDEKHPAALRSPA